MLIVSVNVRTLLSDQTLVTLQEELGKIKWDSVELSEIRTGDGQVTFKSWHSFHYIGQTDTSKWSVEFLVNRKSRLKV